MKPSATVRGWADLGNGRENKWPEDCSTDSKI